MDTDMPASNQPKKGKSKSKSQDRQEKPALKDNSMNNSKNKNTKKQDNNRMPPCVITGHKLTPEKEKFVRDVLVYDIPAAWSDIECLNQLCLWGTVISMS